MTNKTVARTATTEKPSLTDMPPERAMELRTLFRTLENKSDEEAQKRAIEIVLADISELVSRKGFYSQFTLAKQVDVLGERAALLGELRAPSAMVEGARRLHGVYERFLRPLDEQRIRDELWKGRPDPELKVFVREVEKPSLGEAGLFDNALMLPVRDARHIAEIEDYMERLLSEMGVKPGPEGLGHGLWRYARTHFIKTKKSKDKKGEHLEITIGEVACKMTKKFGRGWYTCEWKLPRSEHLAIEGEVGRVSSIHVRTEGIGGKVVSVSVDVGRSIVIFPTSDKVVENLLKVAAPELRDDPFYAKARSRMADELAGLGLAPDVLEQALDIGMLAEWLARNRTLHIARHEDGHRIYAMLTAGEKEAFKRFVWDLLLSGHRPADEELAEIAASPDFRSLGIWWSLTGASEKFYNEAFARLYARYRAGEFNGTWAREGVTHHPLQLALISLVMNEGEKLTRHFPSRRPKSELSTEKKLALKKYFDGLLGRLAFTP